MICSGLFRVSTQENSHVRQTPNNPQTNANTSACGAGTYSGEAASACTTCGTGRYSGEAASVCDMCQAGTYSSVEGATTCTTCGTGKYSGAEGATAESTCFKCQAGTYSGVEGATAATTCQGEFVSSRETGLLRFLEGGPSKLEQKRVTRQRQNNLTKEKRQNNRMRSRKILWGGSANMHRMRSRQILFLRGSDVMHRMRCGNLLCSHSSVCRIDMSR